MGDLYSYLKMGKREGMAEVRILCSIISHQGSCMGIGRYCVAAKDDLPIILSIIIAYKTGETRALNCNFRVQMLLLTSVFQMPSIQSLGITGAEICFCGEFHD
ncbi:hypothetical protein L484_015676 [Morus notabilis]|uniref:Uncharacterized protein n=1 Tax=Morus notabilis TaxID=981085 RepID=W9S8C1_9ROSA|nr:hypothetical protein L484_015676 [Morus notabilis]